MPGARRLQDLRAGHQRDDARAGLPPVRRGALGLGFRVEAHARRAGCKIYVLDISEMAHVLGYPQCDVARIGFRDQIFLDRV